MDKPEQPDREEQDIARLLRAAGPRQELPGQLKAQWEQKFRAELQPVLARRNRRTGVFAALAASIAILAVALWFSVLNPQQPEVAIRVSQVSGGAVIAATQGTDSPLQVGQELVTGSAITTRDNGFVAVSYRGHDVRLNRNTRVTFEGELIRLHAGEVYASDTSNSGRKYALEIATPHGTVRDIGTQFTVSLLPHATVATVRRGVVLVRGRDTEFRALAKGDSAARVTLDSAGVIEEMRVPPSGNAWDWIYAAAPTFTLEGQNALDFLRWSVTESGLRLEFATEAARIYASTTFLHGDFGALNPEQAVTPVLASTDLRVERTGDNTLLVSLPQRR